MKEGIPRDQWCYLSEGGEPAESIEQFKDGMRLAPDHLVRTGYRLPTEAEWEYACRAGSDTTWYFGHAQQLLSEYACYHSDGRYDKTTGAKCLQPVGSLKPNDFGLFDMHGNAIEWCQDRWNESRADAIDEPGPRADLVVRNHQDRSRRGGSAHLMAIQVHSGDRDFHPPETMPSDAGLRVARTLPALR